MRVAQHLSRSSRRAAFAVGRGSGIRAPTHGGFSAPRCALGSTWRAQTPCSLDSRSCASEALRPAATAWSEEEAILKESVAKFAQDVIAPRVQAMDQAAVMDPQVVSALFEQGLMGIETPADLGGAGMGFTAACIAVEEVAKVDPAVAVLMDIQNTLLITAFKDYGNKAQAERYLPLLSTDTVGSFCLSEAGSGSDAFALKTRATRDGDDWILEGTKIWISNSIEAGLFVVFANADPTKGHKGITAFIVDRENPGLKIGKKEDKLGIRASSTCEIILDNCRVPSDAVLGDVGMGYKMAIGLLNEGRIGIGAQMVGLAQGAFDYAMEYMCARKQFGTPIADFQGMQFQYARARMEIEAARVLVYNAARLKESGAPFVQEAAMAKLKASEVAQSVSSQCIDWLGGVGFTKEFLAEKYYRDAKIGTIYEGTSNIQLLTIAKNIRSGYK